MKPLRPKKWMSNKIFGTKDKEKLQTWYSSIYWHAFAIHKHGINSRQKEQRVWWAAAAWLIIDPALCTTRIWYQLLWSEPKVYLCVGTIYWIATMDDVPERVKRSHMLTQWWKKIHMRMSCIFSYNHIPELQCGILCTISSPANLNAKVTSDGAWFRVCGIGFTQHDSPSLHHIHAFPHLRREEYHR